MRLNYLANAIGLIMIYIGTVIMLPVLAGLYYKETFCIIPFLTAGLIAITCGMMLRKIIPDAARVENINDIKKSEALCIVTFSWIIFAIIASIPYLFYGLSPIDSLFEAVSGITTTGATVITHFNYDKAFFFWRSLTQWLGGLGIIVLFIAILPQFAVAGRQMFFAEAPGPTEDKITPRIRNTASALWKIYAVLTVIEIILLKSAGMPGFDAVCTSLSTLAAGGFSPNPESIMGYHSDLINRIVIFFMFLSGTSFILQYRVITSKKPLLFFKNEEFKMYLSLIFLFSITIAVILYFKNGYTLSESITSGLFQTISISTSTGSASVDYTQWNFSAQVVLFIVMFMGGCASSAGGGVKMTRWILVFKSLKSELIKILHPNAVINIKVDNTVISQEVIRQIFVFVFYFFLIFALGAVIITITEHDIVTGLSGAISAVGNVGPGLGGTIGPMGSFGSLHIISKSVMIIGMLVGRLEIIPFLVFFQGDFWQIKK